LLCPDDRRRIPALLGCKVAIQDIKMAVCYWEIPSMCVYVCVCAMLCFRK
jgi:hypothetical protein